MISNLNLIALLESYEASTDLDTDALVQMKAVASATPSPLHREQYVPGHFTGSSFVLSSDASSLLLIYHQKLQLWLQPGGHFEAKDASLIEGAERELAEETGLTQPRRLHAGLFDIDIHTIPARKGQFAHLHFDLRFLFQAQHDPLQAGSDAVDARWYPLAEVEKCDSDASVARTAARIQKFLRSAELPGR